MTEELSAEVQLLRSQKIKLIDILSADADFVLQHVDSLSLLSLREYQQVKTCRIPSEKVTELLDCIILKGPAEVRGLLELLKSQDLQKTFPKLRFIKDVQVNTLSSAEKKRTQKRKKQRAPDVQVVIPSKQTKNSFGLLTEKQAMLVAYEIGHSWKAIGRMALDVTSVKLQQIEADQSVQVERVFEMLWFWRNGQKEKATPAHLHSLLKDHLPPDRIDFLLKSSAAS